MYNICKSQRGNKSNKNLNYNSTKVSTTQAAGELAIFGKFSLGGWEISLKGLQQIIRTLVCC